MQHYNSEKIQTNIVPPKIPKTNRTSESPKFFAWSREMVASAVGPETVKDVSWASGLGALQLMIIF